MYTLRPHQSSAVNAALTNLQSSKPKNGILVLPTAAGKSLIVASIAKAMPADTLVLQPNKEILEQNVEKMRAFGVDDLDIGIYSASAGEKTIKKITFATIGSIIKKLDEFKHFSSIIVDECHGVNPNEGMYKTLIDTVKIPVIGLTATPFRLHSKKYMNGHTVVEAKFLHRTRPRIFTEILHTTQVSELYDAGYLCPIKYDLVDGYDQDKLIMNSTGMDWLDESVREYNSKIGLVKFVEDAIARNNAKHTLVFCKFVEEAEILRDDLRASGKTAEIVTGETTKKERARILEDFKNGKIEVVTNVGVLTTGFDFPELDCVVMARPTQSVALYYQIVGRIMRTHPDKPFATLVDLCGNVKRFGEIKSFKVEGPKGQERMVSNTHPLTGWNFFTNKDLEEERRTIWGNSNTADEKSSAEYNEANLFKMPYGKYKGALIKNIPRYYITYMLKKGFVKGAVKKAFEDSLK